MSAPNPLPPGSYRANFAFPSGTYLLGDAFALTPPGAPWQGRPWRILDLISGALLGPGSGCTLAAPLRRCETLRNLKDIGPRNYRRATHEADGRPLPANEVPR